MKGLLCEQSVSKNQSHPSDPAQSQRSYKPVSSSDSCKLCTQCKRCSSLNTVTLDTGHKTCLEQQKSQGFFSVCVCVGGDRVSLWNPGWPWTQRPLCGADTLWYRCVSLCRPRLVSWVCNALVKMSNENTKLLKFTFTKEFFPNKSLKVTRSRSSFGELIF